jgi:hypothetical protein
MANINHNTLTDPYLHEPKGASTAASGAIYIADGAGSGDWKQLHNYINGYIAFDATTPAYTHSVTTSFTALNPTFSVSLSDDWTGLSSPNARLKYTGTADVVALANFSISYKNASGTNRDVEMVFYKNGTALNGGHVIATAVAGEWKVLTLADMGDFSTDDYLEVFIKGSASFSLNVAAASLTVVGAPI